MVEQYLDNIFHALADQTRRNLLEQISHGKKGVSELASQYDISLNGISKHLKVLEKAKLIKRTIIGRNHYCETNPQELLIAQQWIEFHTEFWSKRLDGLDIYINEKIQEKK